MKNFQSNPILYLSVFMVVYLVNPSVVQKISEAMLIQTAAEWEDVFCKMQEFNQTIKGEGCKTVYVLNNLCYGQCNSIFMPYKKQELFTCYQCTAVKKRHLNVTQQCIENHKIKLKLIRVNIVEKCECTRTKFKFNATDG